MVAQNLHDTARDLPPPPPPPLCLASVPFLCGFCQNCNLRPCNGRAQGHPVTNSTTLNNPPTTEPEDSPGWALGVLTSPAQPLPSDKIILESGITKMERPTLFIPPKATWHTDKTNKGTQDRRTVVEHRYTWVVGKTSLRKPKHHYGAVLWVQKCLQLK